MAKKSSFTRLLTPGRIGNIELKNRLIMPSMGTNLAEGGFVNQAILDHYEARAKGGVGLIIVEVTCVWAPIGKNSTQMLVFDDDKYLPGMTKLVEIIHHHGAKAVLQLSHTGRGARKKIIGDQPIGPSNVPMPFSSYTGLGGEIPRALTKEEIIIIEEKFADASSRAKKAGFDGVMIHGAGYYLVAQFVSSTANIRTDEYGGNIKNRARFPLEIISAIQKRVGKDFPILYKMNSLEIGKGGGLNLIEGIQLSLLLQHAGVAAIELIAMGWGVSYKITPPSGEKDGLTVPLLMIFSKFLKIPLIAEGRINPILGEQILKKKYASFIGIARGLLANPDLPQKVMMGNIDDLKPCIGCGRCIDNQLIHESPIMCSVNPMVGQLAEKYAIIPTNTIKKIMVIGGGPSGMQVAIVAAQKGHNVLLYEKDNRLGGQLNQAILPPHKRNLTPLISYLVGQIERAGVQYNLGIEVTSDQILKERPDIVIFSTGVTLNIPQIPGIRNPRTLSARDVLNGTKVGKKVVIIGGGLIGSETAEFLLQKGKKVTIIELLPELAIKMVITHRVLLLERLHHLGIKIYTESKCVEICDQKVLISDKNAIIHTIPADNVVIAVGDKPDLALYSQIKEKIPNTFLIGDCFKPEGIAESIEAGYRLGLSV